MYKPYILLVLLFSVAISFHLEKAKVVGKVGEFLKKKTRFGDVYLHREHEDGEEVELETNFNPV